METYTKGMAGKEIASKVKETIHKYTEARAQYYRQALTNVLFLYGRHHFTLSRTSPEPTIGQRIVWELEANRGKGTLRRTSNYLLPLFRAVYSRLIRQKSTVHAEATTQQQTDRDAAKVSKEVSEDFWDNTNRNNIWMPDDMIGMQAVLMKLILYKMTVGMGYLFPYFNPNAKTYVYDEMRKDTIYSDIGEAEVRVDSPFNVFKDKYNRFVIHRRLLCPEQIEYELGKKLDPSEIDEEAFDIKISRILDGNEFDKIDKDAAYLYQQYFLPCKEYPKGKIFYCSENDVLADEDLPAECKERIPCFEFKYQDLGFSRHAQGAIEQAIDLQQDLNFNIARIAQHIKMFPGKLLVPDKAKLKTRYNDVVGQIIQYQYGFKPSFEAAAAVPPHYFENIKRIREDMENMLNSHDASMGRTPKQVKSGVGMQQLQESDDAQIAPELIMFEMKLGFFMEHILDICQYRYQERRLLKISGEDMAYQVKSFIGSDLMGRKRIKVKMGSMFPLNKSDRMNYILMLRKEGFISPEKAKELMEFNDIEGAFTNLDEIGAKQDILNIIEGQSEVIPEQFEDHTIYLKVINDFRKGPIYQKLPVQIRERINQWAEAHQQFLLAEQQAAAKMGGPLPPAARPQMQPAG